VRRLWIALAIAAVVALAILARVRNRGAPSAEGPPVDGFIEGAIMNTTAAAFGCASRDSLSSHGGCRPVARGTPMLIERIDSSAVQVRRVGETVDLWMERGAFAEK
jgi:hypothetical protein